MSYPPSNIIFIINGALFIHSVVQFYITISWFNQKKELSESVCKVEKLSSQNSELESQLKTSEEEKTTLTTVLKDSKLEIAGKGYVNNKST